jgi:hypothetical protein
MIRGLGWYRIRGRSRASLLVSVGIHLIVAIGLLNMVFRYPIGGATDERPIRTMPERLRYVRVAAEPSAGGRADTATATRASGPVATRRIQAPSRIPMGIPEPARTDALAAPGVEDRAGRPGRGDDVTPATGIQPSYVDPRLWPEPGPFTPVPKTMAERTDSAVKAAFGIFTDSMRTAEANKGRAPGDWTIKDKNGGRWGWDQGGIRLGKVTIPQALLAILPMSVQANPTFSDPVTVRDAAFRRADIQYHSNRAIGDDEFRRAIKRIRERKDRERAAEKAEKEKANGDRPQPAAIPTKAQK